MAEPETPSEEPSADPCIFCSIVEGDAPAAWVAERERAVAFLTLGPLQPGHALVIPRAHAVSLADVAAEDWLAVTELAVEVAQLQRERLGATGITLFLASDKDGEQSVFHLHLHMVPRREEDGINLSAWWETKMQNVSRAKLDEIARRLRGEPESDDAPQNGE